MLTTSHGHPIDDKTTTLTVGERGPVPIQDFVFLDDMAHFDRERIPERVVHAKGAGMSVWLKLGLLGGKLYEASLCVLTFVNMCRD